jgi:hypothetical protein
LRDLLYDSSCENVKVWIGELEGDHLAERKVRNTANTSQSLSNDLWSHCQRESNADPTVEVLNLPDFKILESSSNVMDQTTLE